MRLEEVAPEDIKRVAKYRWDRIVEKHEGPWEWDYLLDANLVEFINVNGFEVLLPVDKEHHPNITIIRCVVSADEPTSDTLPAGHDLRHRHLRRVLGCLRKSAGPRLVHSDPLPRVLGKSARRGKRTVVLWLI